ncbi:CBS domain-containing protein [Halorubrum vacuolatum]|uniref:CBS domain-containing protein n=1 Tax=Halorubrum vacuolatum TaxID=63740 RepID=A0A238VAZ6_HALVU|nr:CBS domain-containing protein [Halorubrum vacuolatum]SNR30843.1 CBS domain-containing protein [Halorubrum vacuolatum]
MRTDTMVRDVMHREFLGVSESDALPDAAELLIDEGTDCLIVVRGSEPIGCLEARDALAAVLNGHDDATVDAVMRDPLPTVTPADPLSVARERLVAEGVSRLVVIDDGEAVGVVTEHDALAAEIAREADPRDPERDFGIGVDPAGMEANEMPGGQREERSMSTTMAADETNAAEPVSQGVCEMCGSLTSSLANSNGQAVCPACRGV